MQVAQDALNPSKQYYALLRAYKKGKKDLVNMPYLITMSRQFGDTNCHHLLSDYYAYLLSEGNPYTKENIAFIASTLESSSHPLFSMFYPDEKSVDNVMEKAGYARNVIVRIILKEKVTPFLNAAEGKAGPDWRILYYKIVKDYQGDYADLTVLEAKMKWYQVYENMLKYAIALNDKMEKYGSDTSSCEDDFKLNNIAFILWMNIKDISELKRITGWMAGVVRRGEKASDSYTQYWPLYIANGRNWQ